MQAVIQTGGKQYLVAAGDKVKVEKLAGDAGDQVTFDQVLLVQGDSVAIGAPVVAGAKVLGKILGQGKARKVVSYKVARRKGFHKTKGHRQEQTEVEIQQIQI